MGQYFVFVNLDKREYFRPHFVKLWEIMANAYSNILVYLTATNNPDGTVLMTSIPKEGGMGIPKGWKVLDVFRNWYIIGTDLKYFGRWCGDRVAVVGDYSDVADNYDGPSYREIMEEFKDITDEVVEEFDRALGPSGIKYSRERDRIRIDMMF